MIDLDKQMMRGLARIRKLEALHHHGPLLILVRWCCWFGFSALRLSVYMACVKFFSVYYCCVTVYSVAWRPVNYWSHQGHFYLWAHIAHVLHSSALAGVGSIHMPGMGNPAFNTNMFGYPSAQRSSAVLNHSFFMRKLIASNSDKAHFPNLQRYFELLLRNSSD